jgi:ribose/xylose/arabinose/galactoside ABC-type transport system permease subunit
VKSSLSSDSQTGSIAAEPTDRARLNWLGHTFKQYGIIVAFLAICAVLAILNPVFVSPGNISNVLLQTTINGILSLGMTLVILTGGIDLSVGSTLGISGIFGALMVSGDHPLPTLIAVPLVLLFGALIGLINGTLVTTLKIPAFVTTLGMLSVGRGFAQILALVSAIANNLWPVHLCRRWQRKKRADGRGFYPAYQGLYLRHLRDAGGSGGSDPDCSQRFSESR